MINAIILPRPMVNALLHEAQKAGEKPALGLITKKHDDISHHYPVNTNSSSTEIDQVFDKITSNDENIFAIYRSHDSATHQALSNKLADANIMQLVISQDIKGVLQINTDQANQNQQEIELTIRRPDSTEKASVTVL